MYFSESNRSYIGAYDLASWLYLIWLGNRLDFHILQPIRISISRWLGQVTKKLKQQKEIMPLQGEVSDSVDHIRRHRAHVPFPTPRPTRWSERTRVLSLRPLLIHMTWRGGDNLHVYVGHPPLELARWDQRVCTTPPLPPLSLVHMGLWDYCNFWNPSLAKPIIPTTNIRKINQEKHFDMNNNNIVARYQYNAKKVAAKW